MKQIQLERYGLPEEVARCVDVPDVGPAGTGEVVFEVIAFPINPGDVMTCTGHYHAEAIARYLDLAGKSAFSSVGGYRIEGLGVHLFDRIEGDFATILGIPMFKLLAWMRRENLILL